MMALVENGHRRVSALEGEDSAAKAVAFLLPLRTSESYDVPNRAGQLPGAKR